MANKAFPSEYSSNPKTDVILIRGYLQSYYMQDDQKIFLNNFDNRIKFFKLNANLSWDNTSIINAYMQFIYSTLEYYIMPIVNIGLEIKECYKNWGFGKNVVDSLEACKNKYYTKTYGTLDVDNLSESHKLVINTLKDYGMTGVLKNLSLDILDEIVANLNVRYSTTDIINAINYLANHSEHNKNFFTDLKRKYFI